jgi:Fe-S-cluster containining protein
VEGGSAPTGVRKAACFDTVVPVSAEADALCTDCGLCCDGTFYGSVVVAEDEAARLGRVGLRVLQYDGACGMPQPCTALRGCLCDVYADRPRACAAYECELRKSVKAGEQPLEDARAKIAAMRALLATIRAGFEIPDGGSIWETILSLEEPTTPEAARAAALRYGPAIEAVGALLALGRASFEPRFAGGGSR